MSDRFRPISMEQLTDWAFAELEREGSLFGVPRSAFFVPRPDDRFRARAFGVEIETPFGVAAGPHTQMAQNIVAAWLAGARLIELKTVQTLDELDVHKPCIDVEDEGYNVEWSQELRIHQSFDEYLRAWVLVHALHRVLGFPGERPGVVFNMSVGYNLEGIRRPNVQWFLDSMADASAHLPRYLGIVARRWPAVRDLAIPARISDSVTLSTMHGCPADEIEAIARYLLEERGLHTLVKCNPTLLGPDVVRGIVNRDLGFADVAIPDAAFGHDLKYADAVPMFRRLRDVAAARGLVFGLKLSNTLEVENRRGVFEHDPTMYMSGRPLHAVTVNLAAKLAGDLPDVPLSFVGGADCFNLPDLLGAGLRTVTVCSDLLKTGGYLRLLQYPQSIEAAFDAAGARDTDDFIRRTALATGGAPGSGGGPGRARDDVAALARANLRAYAASVREDRRYRKASVEAGHTKTARELTAFDCIAAPCTEVCPVDQAVPRYMAATAAGDFCEAIRATRADNPLPTILGRVCDHLCEDVCVRTHLDQPLAIRHVKRAIMDDECPAEDTTRYHAPAGAPRVAIVGAGPAGLAAARELARDGLAVTVFEARPYPGGIVGGVIPEYRLPGRYVGRDLEILERLGVEFRYGAAAGTDFTIGSLRAAGFAAVFVGAGAQGTRGLGLPGEDATGVIDGIEFLRGVREGAATAIGPRVGVVGAGDSAMDCVRAALRLGAGPVSLIYRRTLDQMPADREEIEAAVAEGARVVELARPVALRVEGGRLAGVTCRRTEYRGERDASGRLVPFDVPGSEFEIALDTLILAIGQRADLRLFGEEAPELTAAGFVAVDPVTQATSIAGVYAGGDVSGSGPASVVRAAGDGKRAAAAIERALGRAAVVNVEPSRAVDVHAMALRRGRRAWRVPVRSSGLELRSGWEETVLGYTGEEAVREAGRCLECADFCSLCVSVCPNLALLTYEVEPARAEVPVLARSRSGLSPAGTVPFGLAQRYQVAVLADFCNECGNCVVACPTAGAPYRTKPRLYLDRGDFEAQTSNAFLLAGRGVMEGRFDGATHRVEVGERIAYSAPGVTAVLERGTFRVVRATGDGSASGAATGSGAVSLEPAAVMATLLDGLMQSRPHLPVMSERGTFVKEPALRG